MMRHSATRLALVVSFGAAFAGREANNARAVVILRK